MLDAKDFGRQHIIPESAPCLKMEKGRGPRWRYKTTLLRSSRAPPRVHVPVAPAPRDGWGRRVTQGPLWQ